MSRPPPRVVVTGAIGSGKSLVCSLLSEWGVVVIDADRLGHAVLEPQANAFSQVACRWPQVVVDGRIDRSRLAEIVFSDPLQLDELMSITHPHIRSQMMAEVDRHPHRPVAVEISAPSEQVMPDWPVVVVDAEPQAVHGRLAARGMDENDIKKRVASQRSRSQWLALADRVVRNHSDLPALAREARMVAQSLGLLSQ